MSELLHWVWLSGRPGLPADAKVRLYDHFQSAAAIYRANDKELKALGLPPSVCKTLSDKSVKKAEAILAACDKRQIHIITYQDALYPERLNNIHNPPWLLYVRGKFPLLDGRPVLSIVGTRKPTAAGQLHAENFAFQLAKRGMFIVSGMAAGIDSAANRGALRANCPTVAVLGCGVDVVYPKNNRRLYSDIAAYGAVISEYPPGTRPLPAHFPQRNRIISGLADGVFVIEGEKRSGSLITARHAMEQSRMVFALPGRPGDVKAQAPNKLIKDHAKLVDCIDDILLEYHGYQFALPPSAPPTVESVAVPPPAAKRGKRRQTEAPLATVERPPLDLSQFSGDERLILEQLSSGPRTLEQIVAALSTVPVPQILSLLTILDVKDAVVALPGRIYRRVDVER